MSEQPDSPENQRRFDELVPFFINGTLDHDDQVFVEAFLQQHPSAKDSLSFYTHLRQTIQSLTPDALPDQSRINRLIDRWSEALKNSLKHPSKTTHYDGCAVSGQHTSARKASRLASWWSAIVGVGVGAGIGAGIFAAAVLLLNNHTMPQFLLHQDSWDGMPDIELVLAPGIEPGHETVVSQLERFNGTIIDQFLEGDRYRISVDLKNRAAHQHHLIGALQASGHLDDYVLLANR